MYYKREQIEDLLHLLEVIDNRLKIEGDVVYGSNYILSAYHSDIKLKIIHLKEDLYNDMLKTNGLCDAHTKD